MAKPDPRLFDPARYPFRCEIAPRFTDLDLNQHINNVAMVDILQEARVQFHHATAYDKALAGMTAMTVRFAVDYVGQGHARGPIVNHLGAIAVGRSSHTLAQLAMQDGKPVAYAEAVLVCVSGDKPAEMPASFHAEIANWMRAE
ncbi:MAG: acyl-CoA thioesterase [Sphingomonadaceae bacterium]